MGQQAALKHSQQSPCRLADGLRPATSRPEPCQVLMGSEPCFYLRLFHMTQVSPSSFNSAFKETDAENFFFLKQVLLSGTWDYKSLILLTLLHLHCQCCSLKWLVQFNLLQQQCKETPAQASPWPVPSGWGCHVNSAFNTGVAWSPIYICTAMGKGWGRQVSAIADIPPLIKMSCADFWLSASPLIA